MTKADLRRARVRRLLNLPPVKWDQAVSKLSQAERMEISSDLAGIAQRAALLVGYLDGRGVLGYSDNGHSDGVKRANATANKVRRALGMQYNTSLSF